MVFFRASLAYQTWLRIKNNPREATQLWRYGARHLCWWVLIVTLDLSVVCLMTTNYAVDGIIRALQTAELRLTKLL